MESDPETYFAWKDDMLLHREDDEMDAFIALDEHAVAIAERDATIRDLRNKLAAYEGRTEYRCTCCGGAKEDGNEG